MGRADLLLRLDELAARAQHEASAEAWLDAFLLSAGALQVCEDLAMGLGPAQLSVLRHAAAYRRGLVLRALETFWHVREVAQTLRTRCGRARRLAHATEILVGAVVELARRVLDPDLTEPAGDLLLKLKAVTVLIGRLPARDQASIATIPSSFRSFDQRPSDVACLVERLFAVRESLATPIVVGIRTSGTYLAPLAVAALQQRGVEAALVTARPGAHLNHYALKTLRPRAAGAELLVIDDPPTTGSAVAAVVMGLRRYAHDLSRVTILMATTTDDGSLPKRLDNFSRVTLPWGDWAVRSEVTGSALNSAVTASLGPGERLMSVKEVTRDEGTRREHVRVAVRARVVSAEGEIVDRTIDVRGVGLGYLGGDAIEVGRALGDAVATPLARVGGLLIEETLAKVDPASVTPSTVVDYLARRAATLAVSQDRSQESGVSRSVTEVGATLVARALGPRAALLATGLLSPIIHRVLHVAHPTVIDGLMAPAHWGTRDNRIAKRDYADGAFSSRDLACYDLAYDLAAAAVERDDPSNSDWRVTYGEEFGEPIDDDRWLIYTLVALWERARAGRLESNDYARRCSVAVVDYLAGIYLGDQSRVDSGPLVAIDLDGVLETRGGGYSAPGALGMSALRALNAHGYRVVVATGRSIGEVIHRVTALRLTGGVAEYGSVVFGSDGAVRSALDEDSLKTLATSRSQIGRLNGFDVDPAFAYSIRVSHRRYGGRLPNAEWDLLARVAGLSGDSGLIAVSGDHQVDLVRRGVTKATGLGILVGASAVSRPLVRLAIGDTEADMALFEVAERPFAPGNADPALRESEVTVLHERFQAGVAAAVAREIGHWPGACSHCRLPTMSVERETIVRALSLDEAGPGPRLARTAQLLFGALTRRR